MKLFDVPGIGDGFTVLSLELVGVGSEYFYDDVRSFPQHRKLVAIFVALDAAKD